MKQETGNYGYGKQKNTDKICAVGGCRNTSGRSHSRRHKAAGRAGGACSAWWGFIYPQFCLPGRTETARKRKKRIRRKM